jgi:hypothetical protein
MQRQLFHPYGAQLLSMSIVVSETSPRALLDSALELSYNLNLMSNSSGGEEVCPTSATTRGPGFVLKEVEGVLVQIRSDLDVSEAALVDSGKSPPLMMRLRTHIDCISTVLTGNDVAFAQVDTTTLHELIESLSLLNRSVCTTEHRTMLGCVIN